MESQEEETLCIMTLTLSANCKYVQVLVLSSVLKTFIWIIYYESSTVQEFIQKH